MSNTKRRDQTVRLKSTSNGKVVTAKVVQHDSVQGYLAIRPDNEWMWFKPKDWREIE